ncbi:MAG: hypothetical protein KC912_10500 [Proteobacteria bacterium]|nr:hypothetical protein [Pseudomonadota bacterium]
MSEPTAPRMLGQMLARTEDAELDCDAFVDALAVWIEGKLPAEQRTLFAHHRAICPDCEEQLLALERALADDE